MTEIGQLSEKCDSFVANDRFMCIRSFMLL